MDIRALLSSITRRPLPAVESNQASEAQVGPFFHFLFSVSQTSAGSLVAFSRPMSGSPHPQACIIGALLGEHAPRGASQLGG
jgi:hypothetical protein